MKFRGPKFKVLHGLIAMNAFFIIVSSSIILSSMWINSIKNAQELVASLFTEIQSSVTTKTQNYFAPAEYTNRSTAFMLHRYFDDPINNSEDTAKTFDYYTDILQTHPQFKMIYYSDSSGDLIMLNRMEDNSFSKRFVKNDGSNTSIRWEHANPSYYGSYSNSREPAQTGYDPRKRIWYTLAESAKTTTWTPVYLFATDHLPGFTCAAPLYNTDGELRGVSCIDIAVNELSLFLGSIQPTVGTKIIILDKQNNLVAIQAKTNADLEKLYERRQTRSGVETYSVTSIDAFDDEAEKQLLKQAIQAGSGLHLLKYQGENYQTTISPVSIGNGLELNIGIIIPEDDIIGSVRKNLYNVTIFSIFMLVGILVLSTILSNAIAKPMRILSVEMAKIKVFNLDSEVELNTGLLEILDMRESFESMRSGLQNFKRYVPSDLVAQLINGNIVAGIGGDQRELTMFFSDIAHFTTISENMKPKDLVNDLCVYFELISKTILDNHGTIDKYIGDSVMAFWGAPVKMDDHAQKACASAILIRNNLAALFRQWDNQGKASFHTRIGIHSGEVTVGNMGYNERLNYTVIGDSVNVASRLEGANKIYGTDIMVSEDTHALCKDFFEFRLLDKLAVKGRKEGFAVYELYSVKDDIDKPLRKLFQCYENGLKYYFGRNFKEALKYFNTVLKYRPGDNPSKVMHDRCHAFLKEPPPAGWDGAYVQQIK
ncbi:adenylate/guanylate cyclase domain-containing protein [Breznakiellaceae bacterium SP9]